jgi:pimeloyl-ACP methyl ester carboxylesterase
MPYAEANGQRLYYEIHGDGAPLLCVMGLGADLTGWSLLLPTWSKHYRIVTFDNRDVGRSSYASGAYEIGDMARDTVALADALELGDFHLLGMSMGGAIVQEVALALPRRAKTLTLCVSYGGVGSWGRERARLQVQASLKKSDEELLDELLLLTFSEMTYEQPGRIEMMRNLILSYAYRQRRDGFIRQLQASALHETRDRLPGLNMPVCVIGAEQDLLVPAWKSRELAALIPGARLQIVAGAAHAINVERPEELATLVLEFLQAADAGGLASAPTA